MVEVAAKDAKAQFDELLDRASHGEVIVITRDGEPVAEIMPAQGEGGTLPVGRVETDKEREARLDMALTTIETLSRKYADRRITIEEIREWINEGRP